MDMLSDVGAMHDAGGMQHVSIVEQKRARGNHHRQKDKQASASLSQSGQAPACRQAGMLAQQHGRMQGIVCV